MPYLTKLFNSFIDEGTYPNELKIAKCVPIYNGCNLDKNLPISYRPISILNSINKVLEKCIHQQISNYIEDNKILPHFQYGYRKGHNTLQALSDFINYIEDSKKKGLYTIAIYMDLSKHQ